MKKKLLPLIISLSLFATCTNESPNPLNESNNSTELPSESSTERVQDVPTIGNATVQELGGCSEGYFVYQESTNQKWGYLNLQGDIVVQPAYDEATPFSEGLAAVRSGDRWGYIKPDGSIQIGCEFEKAGHFSEMMAPVMVYGKWGYIDATGKMVVDAQYYAATAVVNGVYCVAVTEMETTDTSTFEVHQKESTVASFSYENVRPRALTDDLIIFEHRDPDNPAYFERFYSTLDGTRLLGGKQASPFHEGAAYILRWTDNLGVGNLAVYQCKVVSDNMSAIWVGQYYAYGNDKPYAEQVMSDGWIAVPDMTGINPIPSDELTSYIDGDFDPDYPVYNVTGAEKPPGGDWADSFENPTPPHIPMTYINIEGDYLAVSNYAKGLNTSFSEGLAYFESADGEIGYIDSQGQLVIRYSDLEKELGEALLPLYNDRDSVLFQYGYVPIHTEGGYGLINANGEVVLKPQPADIIDIIHYEKQTLITLSSGEIITPSGDLLFHAEKIQKQRATWNADNITLYDGLK